jgi:Putative zinc-finger/Photosynthesis system II assembly factor YCF48
MPELPKIVTQRLQTKAQNEALAHPDPDLISAFVENSLPQPDRNQLLEHLARCSDCREVVLFALPEHSETTPSVARPSRSPWLSWPVLRWGALAACVVVVGAAVMLRHESRSTPQEISFGQAPETRTMNEKAPPQQVQATDQAANQPGGTRDKLSAPAARLHVKKAPAAPTSLDTELAGARPSVAQANSTDASTASEAAASPPTAAIDELAPGRAKDVPLESRAANATAGTAARMQAKPTMSMSAVAINKAAYPSATLVPRWTLTSDGTLQRSLDSGTTWETVSVPSQATLRALAANGLDIWVGGSNGALYHSSDAGQHWTQVSPIANGEILSADIIGVEFTDLQHGTLTTSAKETWITADAGQSWLKK